MVTIVRWWVIVKVRKKAEFHFEYNFFGGKWFFSFLILGIQIVGCSKKAWPPAETDREVLPLNPCKAEPGKPFPPCQKKKGRARKGTGNIKGRLYSLDGKPLKKKDISCPLLERGAGKVPGCFEDSPTWPTGAIGQPRWRGLAWTVASNVPPGGKWWPLAIGTQAQGWRK